MNKMMSSKLAGSVRVALLVLLATAAMPSIASAQDNDTKGPKTWMASSNNEPSFVAGDWGRLMLADGELRFRSNNYKWNLSLSDIKRLGVSKTTDRALEVETFNGSVYFVSILDSRMLTESPGKAVDVLLRAVREAPTTSRQTLVAGGSQQ